MKDPNVSNGMVFFSDEIDVTIGVLQMSILGPLFFILFVNDYPKCLQYSNVSIYSDDTSQDVSHEIY